MPRSVSSRTVCIFIYSSRGTRPRRKFPNTTIAYIWIDTSFIASTRNQIKNLTRAQGVPQGSVAVATRRGCNTVGCWSPLQILRSSRFFSPSHFKVLAIFDLSYDIWFEDVLQSPYRIILITSTWCRIACPTVFQRFAPIASMSIIFFYLSVVPLHSFTSNLSFLYLCCRNNIISTVYTLGINLLLYIKCITYKQTTSSSFTIYFFVPIFVSHFSVCVCVCVYIAFNSVVFSFS
jgi:hypothetical protein